MDPELKLRGGQTGNIMLHHPLGAGLGALALAAPCSWIASGAEGLAAGALMGVLGLVMGAPLGAMLADSASPEPPPPVDDESFRNSGPVTRPH
jgi:hypothetical protein